MDTLPIHNGTKTIDDWVLIDSNDINNPSLIIGNHKQSGGFFGKVVTVAQTAWNSVPTLPYSANKTLQDSTPLSKKAITKTETQRLLGLKGGDGLLACRVMDGWSTLPYVGKKGRVKSATRDILRLNNIVVFRNRPDSDQLEKCMIGPNHYFGVLDNTHTYTTTIKRTDKGMPYFVKSDQPEQLLPTKALGKDQIMNIPAPLWLTAKDKSNSQTLKKIFEKDIQKQALTGDIGVGFLDTKEILLPEFDPTQFDLSPFGAKLVKNDHPFQICTTKEDAMDVVTYHFGSKYAETAVSERDGLFLETHDFTQIMSPMTKDSGGFITLGRWNKRGDLELIGVKVPPDHSIIINKGAIHGDATFTGSYLMAMTVQHTTMATADVVLLKKNMKEPTNVMIKMPERPPLPDTTPEYMSSGCRPLVILEEGTHKFKFDERIKEEKKPLDKATRTGSSVIYNPYNGAGAIMNAIPMKT